MTVKVVLGLPHLSRGPLLAKAVELGAPVLVSANAFTRWRDETPAIGTPDHVRLARIAEREQVDRLRMRSWDGWNLSALRHASLIEELWLDSAGYSMMVTERSYPWTPESYIFDLCAAYPWTRFSSLDLCVEQEIARDKAEVAERVSKTVNLNYRCQRLADDIGIGDRLMPVIQGADADTYLRCFDAAHGMIGDQRVIGVGSMCRRPTEGPAGIAAIVDALDRRLPPGVMLHLFGLKGDGGEAVADMTHRVYSLDSQAYGVRARHLANERRKEAPSFSKSNAFVAEVMADWYRNQLARMARPRPKPIQNSLLLSFPPTGERHIIDRLFERARAEINILIESGELDHDEIVTDNMLLGWIADWPDSYADLPPFETADDQAEWSGRTLTTA